MWNTAAPRLPSRRSFFVFPFFVFPVLACLLAALPVTRVAGAEPLTPARVAAWRADLDHLARELPARHPGVTGARAEALASALTRLGERLPALEPTAAVVELARIVASLDDGHTRLTLPLAPGVDFPQGHTETEPPEDPDLLFHAFPLRLGIDARGPWVRAVAAPVHRELLGGSVVAVAGRPVDEVIGAVAPVVHRDNQQQVMHHLPMFLVLSEVLHGVGVTATAGPAAWTVLTPEGATVEVELQPLAAGARPTWIDAVDAAPSVPFHLRRPGERFWMQELDGGRLLYLRLREVADEDDDTIRELTRRWTAVVGERRAQRLALDLRGNRGGDASTFPPLLHGLIASPLNRLGGLFVLVDRGTFSAAMSLVEELEDHTAAIFAGEPTGSRPSHYGDARKIRLPETGLIVRASTRWYQSHPLDDRSAVTPQLPVALSREDLMAGRDPVVEKITHLAAPAGEPLRESARWSGELRNGSGAYALELRLERAGAGWVGRVSLPVDGIEDLPVSALELDGPRLSFELTGLTPRPLRFAGTLLGDRIFGHLDLGSARAGFWLAR